jgi:hypothetical protein
MGGLRSGRRNWRGRKRGGAGDSAITTGMLAAASRMGDALSHEVLAELIIVYPGSVSETEILVAYVPTRFVSKARQRAGNHFLTIREGLDRLAKTGCVVLCHRRRAQPWRDFRHDRLHGHIQAAPTPGVAGHGGGGTHGRFHRA